MTDYEILSDKTLSKAEKEKKREQDKTNRLLVEKKMTEDLHNSKIRFDEDRKALLNEKTTLLADAKSEEEKK